MTLREVTKEVFLERAAAGNDPIIRADALRAIRVIDAEYPSHMLEIAVDAQYLNRFDDGIVDTYARYFQRLDKRSPLRVDAGARLLRDTASKVGPQPQIFSDNAFLTGLALAFQPYQAHYFLSADANIAYVFYAGRNGTAALVPDFRTVAGYCRVFRPGIDSSLQNFSFQANVSVGFYFRYQRDAIAYLQPQESYDLNQGAVRLSPFFQQSFAFDTNQQFSTTSQSSSPASRSRSHATPARPCAPSTSAATISRSTPTPSIPTARPTTLNLQS